MAKRSGKKSGETTTDDDEAPGSGRSWVRFRALIRGSVGEQPADSSEMPEELLEAQRLWIAAGGRKGNDEDMLAEILKRVVQSIRCTLVPSNLAGGSDDLEATDDEIQAKRVIVRAADFTEGCVPWVRADGIFEVVFRRSFTSKAQVEKWQEKHGSLADGIVFQFDGKLDSLYIGMVTEHDGIAIAIEDAKPL
jgi:hypothetical protein